MRTNLRRATLAAGSIAAAAVLALPGNAYAVPKLSQSAVAQTCYGGAFDYQSSQEGYWPLEGHAPTSSRCADINVKSNTTRRVRVCFWTGNGHTCNAFRTVPAGQWTVAASNVLDGTRFYLDFEDNKVGTGLVAA